MRSILSPLAVVSLLAAAPISAAAADPESAPVLIDAAAMARMKVEATRYRLFAGDLAAMRTEVDAAMRAGVIVPVPKDPGGGYTHEQHKRNYKAIYGAGLLYRITGERAYADFARRMLLAYARLYPTLGRHPAATGSQSAGRLFWQTLNDSVWLVYAVQGYDAIRDTLSAADRETIDRNVFAAMAHFLSDGSPQVFDRIHNHATWADAGVGMTGYVLRDHDLVEKALKGLDKRGEGGFLRQLDLLFSPDGYYTEGPYYQRYALLPFVLFAHAIDANEPERHIFQYRDGIILKAIRTTIQLTYGGYFFPLNDAMRDKGLRTEELYHAVAIGYGATHDPGFLSIAEWQGHTVLTPEGVGVARGLAGAQARPFPFSSLLLRDGPKGDQGALAILRSGSGPDALVLVAKNTAQGMGHGHFDKLSWVLYANGDPVVTDYGAARFLNIEAKEGGRYLPENESWAKQTIAHNTLVVNQTSHFGGKETVADTLAPRQIAFVGDGTTQISTAEMTGAYPGVQFRRTLAELKVEGFTDPIVIDLLKVDGDKPARYDLPLHYAGHIIDVGFPLTSNVTDRPVLGKADGYQHLWVDATGMPDAHDATLTWLLDGRFYTYRMLPPEGAKIILAESGANDPRFNLRREPVLIERLDDARDASFVAVLEPHGRYDPSAETTVGSRSRITALRHVRGSDSDVVTVALEDGRTIRLAIADDADPAKQHHAMTDGQPLAWTGHWARFDGANQ